jgi:hypothetical protein
MLDLAFALVARSVQPRQMVLRCQFRRQQPDRSEMKRTVVEPFENDWESSRSARRLNPIVRGVLRQVQHLNTVGEQARTAFAEVQPPRVNFRERRDKPRRRSLIAARAVHGRALGFPFKLTPADQAALADFADRTGRPARASAN